MAFDFPDAPIVGQIYAQYVWDGEKWTMDAGSTVPPVDVTAPTLVSVSPTDNATGVALLPNLVMTFSESVAFGTGNISLKRSSDDSVVEAFNVATEVGTGAGLIAIAGAVVTAHLTASLTGGTGYYVTIDATAVDDLIGNSFVGISSKTVWNWTTLIPADVTPPVLSPPTGDATGETTASYVVATNENNGNIYWVVVLATAPPPNANQILFGQDGSGAPAVDSGNQPVSVTGAQPAFTPNGLTSATTYDVWVTHRDAASNNSNVVTDEFTTAAAVPDAPSIALNESWVSSDLEPDWDITADLQVGDIIHCYNAGVEIGTPRVIVSGEDGDGVSLAAAFGALAVGTHPITMKLERAGVLSVLSNTVNVTTTTVPSYSVPVQAWLDATTLTPGVDDAYIDPVETMIDTLIATASTVSGGGTLWDPFIWLRFWCEKNPASSVINIRNPGTFNATLINSPTHVANQGLTPSSTGNKYAKPNFTPSLHGGAKYTPAQGHLMCSIFGSYTGAPRNVIGAFTGAGAYTNLGPCGNSTATYWSLNDASFTHLDTSTQGSGIWLINKIYETDTTLDTKALYRNGNATPVDGAVAGGGGLSANPLTELEFFEGAFNDNGTPIVTDGITIAMMSCGGPFKSAADCAAAMTIINTCLTSLGANGY